VALSVLAILNLGVVAVESLQRGDRLIRVWCAQELS
jgi:hypothetical protein